MIIYVQTEKDGLPYNMNTHAALRGFQQMGFETRLFYDFHELDEVTTEDMVVGGVGRVKGFLEKRGNVVSDIDYPDSLQKYYGRKIWESTTNEFLKNNRVYPVFIKPRVGKQFNGFVCRKESDMIGRLSPQENALLFCSEVVDMAAEWRCFVRYGEILDIRRYTGELGVIYNLGVVRKMIDEYAEAPAAYALDVGLTKDGKTVIVEVNDGYSLGCYGLDPLLYAKLLSARWAQIVGRDDECDF